MKTPPFYANHPEEGMRCMLSVYGMIIEYFEDQEQSWDDLIELTGYTPMKPAWTVEAIVKLQDRGYEIHMIENFDYVAFLEEGNDYLMRQLGKDQAEWIIKHSNLNQLRENTPKFLETVTYECRSPQLLDIDTLLGDDMLVNVQLNSRKLNGLDGYVGHAILVYGKDKQGNYLAHDPGLPPHPERTITPELMFEAMGGESNVVEVTGYKKP